LNVSFLATDVVDKIRPVHKEKQCNSLTASTNPNLATAAVIAAGDQLKAKGVDIATSVPGEPDFHDDHIKAGCDQGHQREQDEIHRDARCYALREAICAWHKRELGSSYDAKECVTNVGGKHSIFNVISVLVQRAMKSSFPRRTGSAIRT